MGRGRKSKYTTETVQAIIDAIAETGIEKAGYEAAGIGHNTYHRWLKEKGEFREAIQKAKAEFRETRPQTLRGQAVQRLGEYLRNETVEVWEKTTKTYDAKGDLTATTRSRNVIKRPCPQWAIDRVLGKNMPVLEAVQVLLNEGIASPSMAAIVESNIDNLQRELKQLQQSEVSRATLEAIVEGAD
jgi:hypothetical protein